MTDSELLTRLDERTQVIQKTVISINEHLEKQNSTVLKNQLNLQKIITTLYEEDGLVHQVNMLSERQRKIVITLSIIAGSGLLGGGIVGIINLLA